MTIRVTAMKAILKSDRRVVLEVEPHYQWYYLTERRTEYSYIDEKGVIYSGDDIELVEYQGG